MNRLRSGKRKHSLERNIVVGNFSRLPVVLRGSRGPLVERRCAALPCITAAARATIGATVAQQADLAHDDLRAILLRARLRVIPRARLDPAFYVELRALLHVVAD